MRAAAAAVLACVAAVGWIAEAQGPSRNPPSGAGALFETADRCQACHNGLITPSGADVSIGTDWRATMMAHSARDPYWQAAVRREVLDHPDARAAIEHECSRCHMPMAHVSETAGGRSGTVFANLPLGSAAPHGTLAADGVSCTVCHQIQPDRLGTRESFTGHFAIEMQTAPGGRAVFGPFTVDDGRVRVMRSATGFTPAEGHHIRQSDLCATCHTLYTRALDSSGRPVGELPEQVPFLEWRHSAYAVSRSCQSCHMGDVREPAPISSTLGEPRTGLARHTFPGANAWMLQVLATHAAELGVPTAPEELDAAAAAAVGHLRSGSASLTIERVLRADGRLRVEIAVANRTGHKLPTAYPSRRAWLHVTVRDASGGVLFESGAVGRDGRVHGNDNDADPRAFEPHHQTISAADQVQIYEDIMVDAAGAVTTGLLSGVRYTKDNRLLPDGFEKIGAPADVAVHGGAAADPDFVGGGDRVFYDLALLGGGAVTVDAELLYQAIGFRWAQNLRDRPAPETDRFVRYYESAAGHTAISIARATATSR